MKKIIITSIIIASLSIVLLPSCSKYEDGPSFSLRTKKNRLTGDWKLETFLVNDVDQTEDFKTANGPDFGMNIEKNGNYKVTGLAPDEGTWSLGGDKDDIFLKSNTPNTIEKSFRILRLANKELWLKSTLSNGTVQVLKLKQ